MANSLYIFTTLTDCKEGDQALIHWPIIKSISRDQVSLFNVHTPGQPNLDIQADTQKIESVFEEIANCDPYKTSWSMLKGTAPTLPFIKLASHNSCAHIINREAYPLFIGRTEDTTTRCYSAANNSQPVQTAPYARDTKRYLTVKERIGDIASKIRSQGHKVITIS